MALPKWIVAVLLVQGAVSKSKATFKPSNIMQKLKSAEDAAGNDLKTCLASANSTATKDKCRGDAKKKLAQAAGKSADAVRDVDVRVSSMASAAKGVKDKLSSCLSDAERKPQNQRDAAFSACRKAGTLKDEIAKSMGKAAKDVKQSDVYKLMGRGGAQQSLDKIKACKGSATKCLADAKAEMAKSKGVDPSKITDFDLKRSAKQALNFEVREMMQACIEAGQDEKSCHGVIKEVLKNGTIGNVEPTAVQVRMAVKQGAARAAMDVGETCEDLTKNASACLDDMKFAVAKAMGKNASGVTTFEARMFQKKGVIEGAKQTVMACVDAKVDDKAATCDSLDELMQKMKGKKAYSDANKKARAVKRFALKVAKGMASDARKTCLADSAANASTVKACLDEAKKSLAPYMDELLKDVKAAKKAAKQKMVERMADVEFFGDMFTACMEEKASADEAAKKADAKDCLKQLANATGKAGAAEDGASMVKKHLASFFKDIAECEASEAAECRQKAKEAARAAGLRARDVFQAKRRGEISASAEVWAACLEASGTNCENAAVDQYKAVSGNGGNAGGWANVKDKAKRMADAIVDGKSTVMKGMNQLDVDARMRKASCADGVKKALSDEAEKAGGKLSPKLRRPGRTTCRVVDSVAEYRLEISANLTDSQFEAHAEALQAAMAKVEVDGRRLASTPSAVGASQAFEECPEGDASCGTSTLQESASTTTVTAVASTTRAIAGASATAAAGAVALVMPLAAALA